jgi:RNA polymerase sigma-70 factor (ECF subfamily)
MTGPPRDVGCVEVRASRLEGLRNPCPLEIRTVEVVRDPDRLGRLPDDALLAALAVGDRDAVTVFVRRFQRRVHGLASTIIGDRVLAEDVAQQAFERAWRHAASYDARRGSVPVWLLTITRNLAIDAMRVRRAVPIDPWFASDLLPPNDDDPSIRAVDTDDLRRLRAELASLPVEQRRAVVLATIGGRTTTEIGAIEGIPVPTAKTRLRTGLRRLRVAMASEVGQ